MDFVVFPTPDRDASLQDHLNRVKAYPSAVDGLPVL
jgi:hypothetical protein